MSFEVTGKLVAKYDAVQRTESFKTREFVLEKADEFNGRTVVNYIKFQCVQDKTILPDKFNLGDEVKVYFNLKGSKWVKDGRENYITNLDAWRMEQTRISQDNAPTATTWQSDAPPSDQVDDLPF